MEHVDDSELKAEIDQISKKIDAIIETVRQLDPARTTDPCPDQGHLPPDRRECGSIDGQAEGRRPLAQGGRLHDIDEE